jgi:hypothetical protein
MTFGHEQLDVYPLTIAEGNGKATGAGSSRWPEGRFSNAARCRMLLRFAAQCRPGQTPVPGSFSTASSPC